MFWWISVVVHPFVHRGAHPLTASLALHLSVYNADHYSKEKVAHRACLSVELNMHVKRPFPRGGGGAREPSLWVC